MLLTLLINNIFFFLNMFIFYNYNDTRGPADLFCQLSFLSIVRYTICDNYQKVKINLLSTVFEIMAFLFGGQRFKMLPANSGDTKEVDNLIDNIMCQDIIINVIFTVSVNYRGLNLE